MLNDSKHIPNVHAEKIHMGNFIFLYRPCVYAKHKWLSNWRKRRCKF